MKKVKGSYTFFIVIIFVFGFSFLAEATEIERRGKNTNFVGFEFGVNYILPQESSFEGTGRCFSLQFPITKGITVGILNETNKYSGEKTVGGIKINRDLDITINEIRVSKNIGFRIAPFLGIGSASISDDLDENTIVWRYWCQCNAIRDYRRNS